MLHLSTPAPACGYPVLVTQPQNPFGRPQGPQFGNPAPHPGQSSFGGWGGGQFQAPGQALPQQQFGQQYQQGTGAFGPGHGAPGQFGPPAAPTKKGPPPVLVGAVIGAGIALVALLVYAFVSGGGSEDVGPDYRNEDYQVPTVSSSPPELKFPETMGELIELLEENPIYEETFPVPVRCDLTLDGATGSLTNDELEDRMTTYIGCLTRAWGPTLEAAGFVAYQPRVTVYPGGGTVNTPCGTAESQNAFFCGGDQNLYLAPDIADVLPEGVASERILFELIMAHEYGHAMQGRTGIFASSAYLAYEEEDESVALELSRRTEVQADCFAGLGLRSLGESMGVEDADVDAISTISFEIGDDQLRERFGGDPSEPGDHGRGENRELWIQRGFNDPGMSVCNTWTAPTSEVR